MWPDEMKLKYDKLTFQWDAVRLEIDRDEGDNEKNSPIKFKKRRKRRRGVSWLRILLIIKKREGNGQVPSLEGRQFPRLGWVAGWEWWKIWQGLHSQQKSTQDKTVARKDLKHFSSFICSSKDFQASFIRIN